MKCFYVAPAMGTAVRVAGPVLVHAVTHVPPGARTAADVGLSTLDELLTVTAVTAVMVLTGHGTASISGTASALRVQPHSTMPGAVRGKCSPRGIHSRW